MIEYDGMLFSIIIECKFGFSFQKNIISHVHMYITVNVYCIVFAYIS